MILDLSKMMDYRITINDEGKKYYRLKCKVYDGKASIIYDMDKNLYWVTKNNLEDNKEYATSDLVFIQFDNGFDAYNKFQELLDEITEEQQQQEQQQQEQQERENTKVPFILVDGNNIELWTCDGNLQNPENTNIVGTIANFDINKLIQKDVELTIDGQTINGFTMKYEPLDQNNKKAFFFFNSEAGSGENGDDEGQEGGQGQGQEGGEEGGEQGQGQGKGEEGDEESGEGGQGQGQGGDEEGGEEGQGQGQGGEEGEEGEEDGQGQGQGQGQGGEEGDEGGQGQGQGQQGEEDGEGEPQDGDGGGDLMGETNPSFLQKKPNVNNETIRIISEQTGVGEDTVFSYFERTPNMGALFLQNFDYPSIKSILQTDLDAVALSKELNTQIKNGTITLNYQ